MDQENVRKLVSTTITDSTDLNAFGSLYTENQEATDKTDVWMRSSIVFGTPQLEVFGTSTQTCTLYVSIFYKEDTGVIKKNQVVDVLNDLFQFKSISNAEGLLQFRGGVDSVIGKQDEDFIQSNYSITFYNYTDIS